MFDLELTSSTEAAKIRHGGLHLAQRGLKRDMGAYIQDGEGGQVANILREGAEVVACQNQFGEVSLLPPSVVTGT